MTAETRTSKTGAIHKYYKCYGKKRKICDCDKHNVRKDDIENFVFEKTKEYVLQPNIIEQITEVVVYKFNSELSENAVLTKLSKDLKQKEKSISAMLDAIEKGIFTNSTQERLLKLENDKVILEEKIAVEKAHSLKPLEKKNIVNFLKIYTSKDFDSVWGAPQKLDKNFNIYIAIFRVRYFTGLIFNLSIIRSLL